jgi:hypothetical protein
MVGPTVVLSLYSIVAGPTEALPSSQLLQVSLKALEGATPIAEVSRALFGVSLLAPIEALPTTRPIADLAMPGPQQCDRPNMLLDRSDSTSAQLVPPLGLCDNLPIMTRGGPIETE